MEKEKISENQFMLIINGPSCGGKSSVSDFIFEKYSGLFKAKSDAVKWLISNYKADVYRSVAHQMINEMIKVALSNRLSILIEGALFEPEEYIKMAKSANVPLFIANIEAPWDVLMSRFQLRIEAKKQGARISNVDPKRFKELHDMYHNVKMDTSLIFDSSKQPPEEISEAIVSHIKDYFMLQYN